MLSSNCEGIILPPSDQSYQHNVSAYQQKATFNQSLAAAPAESWFEQTQHPRVEEVAASHGGSMMIMWAARCNFLFYADLGNSEYLRNVDTYLSN